MKISKQNSLFFIGLTFLFGLTLFSGLILSSSSTFADDNDTVVDDVSITIPMACTLSGVGMNTHNATINNGTYASDIGTTTIKAFCNDNEGFAIYANGYTNNEDGNNVLTDSTLGSTHDIVTGIATSGNTSNWSMKLAKTGDSGDTTNTPFTIDSAPNTSGGTDATFADYHVVPSKFTKVAHKDSSTDMDSSTGGVTLATTYAAYISKTQSAGTYIGQVKYVLVHPSTAPEPVNSDQVGVTYHGNGLTFSGGATKNRVVYAASPMYVGTTATIAKSPNVNSDGTQNGGNASGTDDYDTVTISGADKLKVVITYDLTTDGNTWIGYVDEVVSSYDDANDWQSLESGTSGTETMYFEGDSVTFNTYVDSNGSDSQDYGYYAQVYPLYTTEQAGTTISDVTTLTAETGTYATTTTWKGKWYITNNNETVFLEDEAAVINYLKQNDSLLGTNVEVYAYNPYTVYYNGNGATAGTMSGFYTKMDTISSTADLMAYNFKKAGYGFAGWSEDQNATVNSGSKIYGPNERVTISDFSFNNAHETTLYAVWVPSAGNLQNWSGCSSLGSGQVTALTDNRDNNVYTVGKLADGNCWMMENLRLDDTATALSNDNTNSPYGTFTSLSATSDVWCQSSDTACINKPKLNTNNINIGGSNTSNTTLVTTPGTWDGSHDDSEQYYEGNNNYSQWYGYGNYYNWNSATAGNGFYQIQRGTTPGDICPNGWHLPNGGTDTGTNGGGVSGGFSYLDIQLGGTGDNQTDNSGEEVVSNKWRKYPNNFIYAGSWHQVSSTGRGDFGAYSSRTAYNLIKFYYLFLGVNNISLSEGAYKYYGYSVRCLTQ